jgi:hypothetical protein
LFAKLFLRTEDTWTSRESPRKIAGITDALSRIWIGKDAVSRIVERLEEEQRAWREQPLKKKAYPYLYLDATYLKVNWGASVTNLEGVWHKGKHHLNATILPTFIAKTGQGSPPDASQSNFQARPSLSKLPLTKQALKRDKPLHLYLQRKLYQSVEALQREMDKPVARGAKRVRE